VIDRYGFSTGPAGVPPTVGRSSCRRHEVEERGKAEVDQKYGRNYET